MVLPSDLRPGLLAIQRFALRVISLLLIAFFLGVMFSELADFDRMGFGALLEENIVSERTETAAHSRKQMCPADSWWAENFTSSERKSLLSENLRMEKLLSQLSAENRRREKLLAETHPNASKGVVFGHLHFAKTSGTTLNGNLSMHFERVCGNKGYSLSAYQTNLRRKQGKETGLDSCVPPAEMQRIGFEDCDWISQEDGWTFWKQFESWDQPMELHVPCRDPIDHLLSMCNYRLVNGSFVQGRRFDCAGDLSKEVERCLVLDETQIDYMDRFSMKLQSIPNIHLKCFDWRASFDGTYAEFIGNVLQRKKKRGEYVFWATNRPRNLQHECLLNATQSVQKQVRIFLRGKYDYYKFCDQCMGSEDDIFRAWKGGSGLITSRVGSSVG
jgi:hypothetical protein